jgi:UDP-N-acetylmuramyl pentapeptide phosphotransferase/UDP-N-acetylglucosamine-1-phosphate transferase
MVSTVLFSLLFIIICAWLAALVHAFLIGHGIVAANYRGEHIPVGSGVAIWLAVLAHEALLGLWRTVGWEMPRWIHGAPWDGTADGAAFGAAGTAHTPLIGGAEYALMTAIVCFAGWLDDTVGHGGVKGFGGHFTAWLKEGTVTTGLIKAAAVSAAALWASLLMGGNFSEIVSQWLVITLMTNAFNLVDLRPGRALKVFFLLSAAVIAIGAGRAAAELRYLAPALAGAAVLLSRDLKARAMLGDTGANLLGFALGLTAAAALPAAFLWGIAAMLALFHWFAERRSLTRLIDRNRILSWLDRLGRPQP